MLVRAKNPQGKHFTWRCTFMLTDADAALLSKYAAQHGIDPHQAARHFTREALYADAISVQEVANGGSN